MRDLLDLSSRAEFFGEPLLVAIDESIVSGVHTALVRQAGALSCSWSSDPTVVQARTPAD